MTTLASKLELFLLIACRATSSAPLSINHYSVDESTYPGIWICGRILPCRLVELPTVEFRYEVLDI